MPYIWYIGLSVSGEGLFAIVPVDELPGMQKTIYDELPQSFETRTGLVIAERYGMPERTFKRWLSTSLFRKITTASMRNVIDNPLWHNWHFWHFRHILQNANNAKSATTKTTLWQ